MPMTRADKVFWSIVVIILIGLLWLKFVEIYLSAWFGLILELAIAALIFKFGEKISPEYLLKVAVSKIRRQSSGK